MFAVGYYTHLHMPCLVAIVDCTHVGSAILLQSTMLPFYNNRITNDSWTSIGKHGVFGFYSLATNIIVQSGHNIEKISLDDPLKNRKHERPISLQPVR